MSKRTQSIRSMFSVGPEETLSADNKALPRVTSGAVRSLKETFSEAERDYQLLRDQLASGSVALRLDTALIDPSPFADRFDEDDAQSFEMLKQSLSSHGQEVPILVRENPQAAGRYQCAYGHRRLRALAALGLPVNAYVRPLSDQELVLAQGIENSAREDLSFIERAVFAMKLEDQGFQRTVIQSALSVDRAEVSKLVAVARAVPADIVAAIGRAPRIGRGRWQALADLLQHDGAQQRARKAINAGRLSTLVSDERFGAILGAAKPISDLPRKTPAHVAHSDEGREIARLTRSTRHCRIQIDRAQDDAFADFVMRKLPELYSDYASERSSEE
ncbi:plasmid partitioning protein RepB [Mesorhizobium sp. CAU 1741]|uniref:plasmid partitioning protein RepB n=1 Tax=Mesorhizobium sp. CAU 1741 TaxID=3140366 RepID=UPI00325B6121